MPCILTNYNVPITTLGVGTICFRYCYCKIIIESTRYVNGKIILYNFFLRKQHNSVTFDKLDILIQFNSAERHENPRA